MGLLINRQAADAKPGQDHVKRVIAEMGGKNAIIVDDDADLDEAVVGVIQSAFGYAGQKCSACSRVIVLEGIYDAFLARLVEAARAVKVGPADDPETARRPGDRRRRARERILEYQRIAATEGRVVFHGDAGPLADQGYFVGPMIVADVQPDARVAQEEIFGPVLAVLKANDLDDALRIANGTAVRPDRRPLFAKPGEHRAGHAASSGSATSTSTAGSPGPWSTASRSAGSSSRASAPRPAGPITCSSSC